MSGTPFPENLRVPHPARGRRERREDRLKGHLVARLRRTAAHRASASPARPGGVLGDEEQTIGGPQHGKRTLPLAACSARDLRDFSRKAAASVLRFLYVFAFGPRCGRGSISPGHQSGRRAAESQGNRTKAHRLEDILHRPAGPRHHHADVHARNLRGGAQRETTPHQDI